MHRLYAIALLTTISWAAEAQTLGQRGYLFAEPRVSFTLYGGVALPGASSDLWQFTFDELTLAKSDFNSFDRGLDVSVHLAERVDLVLGFGRNGRATQSESRDYVGTDGLPITQRTNFVRTPIGASLRYNLTDRGRRIGTLSWIPSKFVPWVGAGGGMMLYKFDQVGEFVDANTLAIFYDRFQVERSTGYVEGSAGLNWNITPVVALSGMLRYTRATGPLSRDFQGFKRIDLSGASSAVGITLRIPEDRQ